MKKLSFLPVLLLAFLAFSLVIPAAAQKEIEGRGVQSRTAYVSDDVYSALRSNGSADVLIVLNTTRTRDMSLYSSSIAAVQANVLSTLPAHTYTVRAQYSHISAISANITQEAFELLAANPDVKAINFDRTVYLSDVESDALTQANALHVAPINATGSGVRVAVIDSGINNTHVNLVDDIVHQQCFIATCPNGTNDATDQNGHGTHVSGIITGADGVAPDAEIISLKVFGAGNSTQTSFIINSLNYLVSNNQSGAMLGADVVNLSLGGGGYDNEADCNADNAAYADAFQSLHDQGVIIFVATGNDEFIDAVSAPGCVTHAIGVGSVSDATFGDLCSGVTAAADKVSCFSNTTPVQGDGELTDILAPGCSILAEYIGSTTATDELCGTSMASPTAAGIAAALLSYDPSITHDQMEVLLEDTGDAVTDYRNNVVYPRINALSAYEAIAADLPTPQNLTAVANGANQIDLDWDAVVGATQYNIQHSTNGVSWSILSDSVTDSFSHMNPACGVNYYRVRAADVDSFSLYSNVASDEARTCPLAPTTLTATVVDNNTVNLSWVDNATDESNYVVEVSVDSGAFTVLTDVLAANTVAYTDDGFACSFRTYRVRAYRMANMDYSAYSNTVDAAPCAPANDLIENAQLVVGSGTDTEPNILYATVSAADPAPTCGFFGTVPTNNVWYRYNPATAASLTISTTGSTGFFEDDTLLAVYTGTPGSLTQVACNDDINFGGNNWLSQLTINASAGTNYYILVGNNSPSGVQGTAQLVMTFTEAAIVAPSNDLVENAEVIGTNTYNDLEPNGRNATIAGNDPAFTSMGDCTFGFPRPGTQGIWYRFTPSANGTIDVDTEGTTVAASDTVIGVYSGSIGAFTQVACNDEGGTGNLSFIDNLAVTSGTTYYIHVARWSATATTTAFTYDVNFSSTVAAQNIPPVANDDTATVVQGESVNITVLANDTDANNNPLTVTVTTAPVNGTTSVGLGGIVTYTHNGSATTTDSFVYTVNDGNGGTDTATVNITVTPPNTAPVAVDDSATVAEGGSVTTVDVTANDTDADNDDLAITGHTNPANGTLTNHGDGTFTYIHDGTETTTASFDYTVDDGNGGTDTGTVNITITPVNDSPVTTTDSATVAEGGTVTTVDVTANDTDAEGDELTVVDNTDPVNGTVVDNGDGTFTYTHDGSETTTDSFEYTVSDGNGGTAVCVVNITITPVNDVPVAVDDSATVVEGGSVTTVDVTLNDTDAEGDTLTVTGNTDPANGTLTDNGDGTFTYTHDGSAVTTDSFDYTVDDGNGGTDTGTVTITVTPVNNAPVANDDAATVAEGGSVNVTVLANDTDADNNTLTVTVTTAPINGTTAVDASGVVTYTHNGSESTADSFVYTVNDGNGGTDTATVNITVTAANDAPVAVDDTAVVDNGGSVIVTVLANDTDAEGNPLTVTVTTAPTNGTTAVDASGVVTYTHNGSETLTDSFVYTVNDGNGGTDTATVTVTVNPVVVTGTELLVNGSFEIDDVAPMKQPDSWNVVNKSQDKIKCDTDTVTFAFDGDCAYFFKGSALEGTKLAQKVDLSLHTFGTGDTLTLSFHYKTNAAAPRLKYKVIVRYTDNTVDRIKGTVNTASSAAYTEVTPDFATLDSGNIALIKVQFMNRALAGKIFIDDASLIHMDNSPRFSR